MKIAVTGSYGFVGSHLVKRLIEMGVDIICLDIKNGIDITDWTQVQGTEKFDVLIHLAAKSYVPDSYKLPRDFYYTNIVGTVNALELCRIHKAKMVYTSSYVYGKPKYLPVDEKHPISAFNPYAQSKIIGEHLCKGYNRDFGISVIILRPFNIFGIGQNDNFLIPSIIKQAKSGNILLKDPNPQRDFVYIDDVIEAYIKCIEYNDSSFEIFNIGFGKSYSVKKIAEIIANNLNQELKIEFSNERRKNEIVNTVADITKANNLLNWKPNISLKKGLKFCISMYKQKYDNDRKKT